MGIGCLSIRLSQGDQGVHGLEFPGCHGNQWIDVDLGNFWKIGSDGGKSHQCAQKDVTIHRRFATKGPQQRSGSDGFDHVRRILTGERCQPKDDVGQRFGQDAAQSEKNRRAKVGVTEKAGYEFPMPTNLRLNENFHAGGSLNNLLRRRQHGFFIGQIQVNQTAFGFVQQTVADAFEHNGKTQVSGCDSSACSCGRNRFSDHGNAVTAQ